MLLWAMLVGTTILLACKNLQHETKAVLSVTGKLSSVLSEQPKYLRVTNVILKYFLWRQPIKTYGFHNS